MALNGRLPASMLGTIAGTNRQVLAQLVPQTNALRAAFRAHFGKNLVVTDAYRSYDDQVDVFLRYYTTVYQPGRPSRSWQGRTYWQRPGKPSAAVPGTSNHGWGTALDLGSGVNGGQAWNPRLWTPEHQWLRENGARFGWTHPSWAHDNRSSNGTDEPWHFESASSATPVSDPGTTVPEVPDAPIVTPPDPIQQEDDMFSDQDRARMEYIERLLTNQEAILVHEREGGIRHDAKGALVFAAAHEQRKVVVFLEHKGAQYEADILAGTVHWVKTVEDMADRQAVLNALKVPWSWWTGGPGGSPQVDNLEAFGRVLPNDYEAPSYL